MGGGGGGGGGEGRGVHVCEMGRCPVLEKRFPFNPKSDQVQVSPAASPEI